MALIEDSKGRQDEDSGYGRVFGNSQLGKLISRVHVCAIRNGNELERLLWEATPYQSNLEAILNPGSDIFAEKIHVCTGKIIRKSLRDGPLTDFIILDHHRHELSVVELKDGDTFDTKKAEGELASAKTFANWIAPKVPYPVCYYFCAFNRADKEGIVTGIKNRFTVDEVLAGHEFCERIGVDYVAIRQYRQNHQEANRVYFIKQLLDIPEINTLIGEYMRQQ